MQDVRALEAHGRREREQTCDWRYATDRLGVSRKTLYAIVARRELFGERQGTGATALWVFRKADVDRLATRREHDRRLRESGIVVGRGDEFTRKVSESNHARDTKRAIFDALGRSELLERIATEMTADPDLRKGFDRLDDDKRFEAQAQELAHRIREQEHLRTRVQEILEDDEA